MAQQSDLLTPNLLKIATGYGTFDTYALKSYLNSYGIEVMLDNSYLATAAPHYTFAINGMDIWVFASDWPQANELIKSYEETQYAQNLDKNNGAFRTALSIAFWALWILCTIPPPARGIYFVGDKTITKLFSPNPSN